jgi:hypothetical protein
LSRSKVALHAIVFNHLVRALYSPPPPSPTTP